jgi:hypothetical protein
MPHIQFTQPITHCNDPLHTQPVTKSPKPPSITIGTYNIRDSQNSGLAAAVRAIQLGNYNLAILTETKIPDNIYTKHCLDYHVVCSQATPGPNGGAQGGIALCTRQQPEGWEIESTQFHGPNVLSCLIVTGDTRMPFIGVYLPPSNLTSLPDFEEALTRFQTYKNITIMGDLNADINDLSTLRNQTIATTLANHTLRDLLPHFKQRQGFRHGTTWYQHREGETLRSRCDYILGTDRRLYQTMSLRDPRNYSTDHLMLKAKLLWQPTKSHKNYLRGRKKFP